MHGFPDPDLDGVARAKDREPGLPGRFDRNGQPAVPDGKAVPLAKGAKPGQKAVVHSRKPYFDHSQIPRSDPEKPIDKSPRRVYNVRKRYPR